MNIKRTIAYVKRVLVLYLLFPFSLLYNGITSIRNVFFSFGILREKRYRIPIISIGNLSVGGTGKTPHTEYIIEFLKERYRVACLSRGYRRKTKGYILAGDNETVATIGDEPLQIKTKFQDIQVAVCEKRVVGIDNLLNETTVPELVVLDDAFQHRHVKPGLSILLTDFSNPWWSDFVLPSGRLRENKSGAKRADIIIVTKCPDSLSNDDVYEIIDNSRIKDHQSLFFSKISYDQPVDFNSGEKKDASFFKGKPVLLISGIANPKPLAAFLSQFSPSVTELSFSDHHNFSPAEIDEIKKRYRELPSNTIIITTEKDAMRLQKKDFTDLPLYYIPIKINFLLEGEAAFQNRINKYLDNF